MKKLILLLAIFCTINTLLIAQTTITVSGTITNSSTSVAVPNHQVNILIIDSMSSFYFSQSVVTDTSGAYSIIVQNYPAFALIEVSTVDCNNQTQTQYLWQSPYVANFSICVTPATCQADFTAYPDSMNPLTIQFIDQTNGTPTSWTWDFGDNSSSTLQNPTHTYSQNGIYVVTLSVVCSNTTSSYIDTLIIGGGTAGCQANFTYSTSPANPLMISFTNTSTGNPTSFLWHFGDNTTSTLQNPTHTYAQGGNYLVVLTISGSSCQDSTFNHLVVQNPACVANFTTFPDSTNPQTIHFIDQSIGNPTSWLWNFGDNSTSTLQNPTHTYSQSGTYIITFIIFGPTCQDTAFDTIHIPSGPTTNLFGQVFLGANPADSGYVILYNYNSFDSTFNSVDTSNIEKIIVGPNTISKYYFQQLPKGKYLTKAFLNPQSNDFSNYISTYSGNKFSWNQATQILIDSISDSISYSMPINMIKLNPPLGNTTVSGYVFECPSNPTSNPIPNIAIYLLEYGTVVKASTISNLNGYYEFNNLESKPYTIFAEIINKTTFPINVNPDGSGNPLMNYNIYICQDNITGMEKPKQSLVDMMLFPNPFVDNISIELYLSGKENIDIQIYNITGQMLQSYHYDYLYKGYNKISVSLGSLKSGLYLMRLQSSEDWTLNKKIIKK